MIGSLLILGAGGHGRVVADAAAAAGWSPVAFLDDDASAAAGTRWEILGPLDSLPAKAKSYDGVIVAIADATRRDALLIDIDMAGLPIATIIAPSATVSPSASLAPGCMILAGAVVQIGAQLEVGCIVNTAASVDHDCTLGRCVHVAPGAHIAGTVAIGARAWIGLGATINEGLTLGPDSTVGASAAVTADVPEGTTVVGIPARSIS